MPLVITVEIYKQLFLKNRTDMNSSQGRWFMCIFGASRKHPPSWTTPYACIETKTIIAGGGGGEGRGGGAQNPGFHR